MNFDKKKNEENEEEDYFEEIKPYLMDVWLKGKDILIETSEYKKSSINQKSKIKLNFLLKIARITKSCIKLGYSDKKFNELILEKLLNFFFIFKTINIEIDSFSWIRIFLNSIQENFKTKFLEAIELILYEAVDIFYIFSCLRSFLQIIKS